MISSHTKKKREKKKNKGRIISYLWKCISKTTYLWNSADTNLNLLLSGFWFQYEVMMVMSLQINILLPQIIQITLTRGSASTLQPFRNWSEEMGIVDDTKNANEVNITLELMDDLSNNISFYNGSIVPWSFESVFNISVCSQWGPVNHMFFQLANTFFFLSYLAPNGMYGILYLRCTLLIGCAFFAWWGWAILCSFDAFIWNANFVAINFIHVCVLLYHLRPIKFSKEIEEVRN